MILSHLRAIRDRSNDGSSGAGVRGLRSFGYNWATCFVLSLCNCQSQPLNMYFVKPFQLELRPIPEFIELHGLLDSVTSDTHTLLRDLPPEASKNFHRECSHPTEWFLRRSWSESRPLRSSKSSIRTYNNKIHVKDLHSLGRRQRHDYSVLIWLLEVAQVLF